MTSTLKEFRLIAVEEALRQAKAESPSFAVYGYLREEEGLIQVLSAVPAIGMIRIGNLRKGTGPGLSVLIDEETPYRLQLAKNIPEPAHTAFVSIRESMDTRRVDVISGMESKKVAFLGSGSLGSMIALLVAQAGVGNILMVDYDRLDASNISRHACDLADLGRLKATATADLLSRRMISASALEADITELSATDRLQELLAEVDLAVTSTDSIGVQLLVNDACVSTKTPLVAAGAYERAAGGEVVLVQPESFCLFCAVGFRSELIPELSLVERKEAYQDGSAELPAEPGLAVDICFIASTAAAYALAALDPESAKGGLTDPGKGFVLFHGGSKPSGTQAQLFENAFDLIYAQPVRETPCPVCSWQSLEAASL